MKSFLSTPKIAIPTFAIVAIIAVFFLYHRVGVAPAVEVTDQSAAAAPIAPGSTINLSFPKGGRIEAVSVRSGDTVRKGQILAKLSAPDAEGAVSQAKGALDLARAQFASLNSQYTTAQKQQDQLVENAYRTMVSSGLAGEPSSQTQNSLIVSGTYTCGTEGSYVLRPYASNDSDTGYSVQYSGLESGTIGVKYDSAVPLGTCGLHIRFTNVAPFNQFITWTISIPNKQAASYVVNKNAYDLAVATREKTLKDLETSIGGNADTSVAQAQIAAAEGAYQAVVGAYQNNLIIAPADGTVTFIDSDAKPGESVPANKTIISITAQ